MDSLWYETIIPRISLFFDRLWNNWPHERNSKKRIPCQSFCDYILLSAEVKSTVASKNLNNHTSKLDYGGWSTTTFILKSKKNYSPSLPYRSQFVRWFIYLPMQARIVITQSEVVAQATWLWKMHRKLQRMPSKSHFQIWGSPIFEFRKHFKQCSTKKHPNNQLPHYNFLASPSHGASHCEELFRSYLREGERHWGKMHTLCSHDGEQSGGYISEIKMKEYLTWQAYLTLSNTAIRKQPRHHE